MKVLVASDFYAEYELYDTDDPDNLQDNIKDLLDGKDVDTSRHRLIGYQDTLDTQEAIEQADKIVYISDLVQEGEQTR